MQFCRIFKLSGVSGGGGIPNVVSDTTPQLGGFLDPNGHYIGSAKGVDIASAAPLVIGVDGDYFDVTGTTGFAAMTVAANRVFTLQFDGILTITHGAGLVLPSGANITTAAGDVATFQSVVADTVVCVAYTKADGTPVVSAGGATLNNLTYDGTNFASTTEGRRCRVRWMRWG